MPEKDAKSAVGALTLAGKALYGDRWKSDLARALNVDPRTVRSWAEGREPTPPARLRQIGGLLAEHATTLAGLAKHFEAEYGAPLFDDDDQS